MGFKKEFFVDCVGSVTILMDDRILFQGQVLKDDDDRHHDDDKCCPPPEVKVEVKPELCCDPEFIVIKLICDPAIIRDNANIQVIEPHLFEIGDIIRINVDEIIAVGPSRCCLEVSPG
ncbi:MAG: hypothetical protein P4N41_18010 [Negativicutes bacterium]|nr:hypothetical protein [Negativicutes bacterium]